MLHVNKPIYWTPEKNKYDYLQLSTVEEPK